MKIIEASWEFNIPDSIIRDWIRVGFLPVEIDNKSRELITLTDEAEEILPLIAKYYSKGLKSKKAYEKAVKELNIQAPHKTRFIEQGYSAFKKGIIPKERYMEEYLKNSDKLKQKRREEYKKAYERLKSHFDSFLFFLFDEDEKFSLEDIKQKIYKTCMLKLSRANIEKILKKYEEETGQLPARHHGDGTLTLNTDYNTRRISFLPYLWPRRGNNRTKYHLPDKIVKI